jgi:predicted RNase H-like HicB family nuclease
MKEGALETNLDFTVVLQPQPDGGFTVSVPALPEIATEGDTEAEALAMATDAIRLVLDYRKDNAMAISTVKLDSDVIAVETTDTALRLMLADGRELTAPLEWFPRLRDATQEQRLNWRLIGGGQGVHWPELDEDIAVATLLRTG